jgi:hypothetical protein
MKKISLLALLITIALLGLSGCKEDTAGAMAGSWTLISSQDTAGTRVLGDGNFYLDFIMEVDAGITVEYYTGGGNIGTYDYLIDAFWAPVWGFLTVSLYQTGENSSMESIDLDDDSYNGGDQMEGDYSGYGVYAIGGSKYIGDGTFTATRN